MERVPTAAGPDGSVPALAELCCEAVAAQLLGVHGALELGATSELMVVSDDAALIRGAKKARIF